MPFAQTPEFSIWCRIETVNILVTHCLYDRPCKSHLNLKAPLLFEAFAQTFILLIVSYIELHPLVDIPRSVRRQIETLQGPNHLITNHANIAVTTINPYLTCSYCCNRLLFPQYTISQPSYSQVVQITIDLIVR
ncbi:uncharacterized protein EAE98_006357 [Botrytis deweyae]|uniref:Uncharacterized protein n=1 Tax=Botrytis deweyae TaxID=2478750 RepID=A0ABQ7IKP5_9HELO|nr:uncharacterized protein EAE98_006357 [Botrytis deweyae]KAF7926973.1 hypothetical protein EAE98_006357 [Botrytis deweyae]